MKASRSTLLHYFGCGHLTRSVILCCLFFYLCLVSVAPCDSPSRYLVTPVAGPHGAIFPSTPRQVNSGGSLGFYVTPQAGYTVDAWRVNGTVVTRYGWSFVLKNITADCTVSVTFAKQIIVTPVAGEHGAISPANPQKLKQGDILTFTATPGNGYRVLTWTVNGVAVQQGGSRYVLRDTQSDCTVGVSFQALSHTVTPVAGPHGAIFPATPRQVNSGDSLVFYVTPAVGYTVDAWRVNGTVVSRYGWSFVLNNITAACTVSVTFVKQVIVTPVAGEHGAISPAIPKKLKQGDVLTLTATPDNGYTIDYWAVDGQIVQRFGTSYTLQAVADSHTVRAEFKPQILPPPASEALVYIASYAGDRAAAVSYTFDDGSPSQCQYAVPALQNHGVYGTFFIVPDYLNLRSESATGGWLDWQRVANLGHEIGNHSKSHLNLTQVTDSVLDIQINVGAAEIAARIGAFPRSFACPYNAINDRVRDAVLQQHEALREQCIALSNMTANQARAQVEAAIQQRRWLVLMIHDVLPNPSPGAALPLAAFETHLQCVKEMEDQVWVARFGEVASYLRESLAASLEVMERDGATLRFRLTSTLAVTQATLPLTVVLRPPSEAYTTVTVKYEGDNTPLPVTYTASGAMLSLRPSPDILHVQWHTAPGG